MTRRKSSTEDLPTAPNVNISYIDTKLNMRLITNNMTNNKLRLNANKTDFIIIGTSRQSSILIHFFPTNILYHSITPSDSVRNLGVKFDRDFNFRKHISLTCRSCFYHIRDVRRIRRYFLFRSLKQLIQHSVLVGLITATLFFIILHLRMF